MSNTAMFIMVGEIFIGFLFMMSAFACFMYKKPLKVVWALVACAVVFLTILPVSQAIGWGTTWIQ
ncbi:hypothetical protein [Corynebacterium hindlerae]|uniref:hypothetical protein n=1 Tax=Corynebacterium hindlerae TaxID=699041 RepID=UPI001AD781D2|nr:hypothetical protein [Corynebacterium hindlerae]QTH59973.1 hypothetical protein J5O04_02175 [Corynebacterium hindlerae]